MTSDLGLDVGELGDQPLAHDWPALARHLRHLGHLKGLPAVGSGQVLRHLILQAVVLHQTDEEGGGPAPGPLQQQAHCPAGPRGQLVGLDSRVQGLLSHGAVGGPLAPWTDG